MSDRTPPDNRGEAAVKARGGGACSTHPPLLNSDEVCNYCGCFWGSRPVKYLRGEKQLKHCLHCGSRIRKVNPKPESGHRFPHNHRPKKEKHNELWKPLRGVEDNIYH